MHFSSIFAAEEYRKLAVRQQEPGINTAFVCGLVAGVELADYGATPENPWASIVADERPGDEMDYARGIKFAIRAHDEEAAHVA